MVVAAAAVIATDGPNILVYGLALVTSAISLAFRPAQASLLPRLATDPLELTAANVVASTIESVGFFAGPALAGLLLAIADVEVVYVVNAVTFLVSAALIAGLTVPAALAPERPRTNPMKRRRRRTSSARRWRASMPSPSAPSSASSPG